MVQFCGVESPEEEMMVECLFGRVHEKDSRQEVICEEVLERDVGDPADRLRDEVGPVESEHSEGLLLGNSDHKELGVVRNCYVGDVEAYVHFAVVFTAKVDRLDRGT